LSWALTGFCCLLSLVTTTVVGGQGRGEVGIGGDCLSVAGLRSGHGQRTGMAARFLYEPRLSWTPVCAFTWSGCVVLIALSLSPVSVRPQRVGGVVVVPRADPNLLKMQNGDPSLQCASRD
jgi:hypothetical protein